VQATSDNAVVEGEHIGGAVPPDDDRDPERFRLARAVLARHAVPLRVTKRGALAFAVKP
jgi:hypothetical protein